MRSIRQKLQIAAVLTFGLTLGVSFVSPKVLAAAPGTCIIDTIQGQSVQKVVKCKDEMPSGHDAAGVAVNPAKCYEVSEARNSVTINQELLCSNPRLDGAALVLCPNGTKAPNNDASKCTNDSGVIINCPDGDPAPENDVTRCAQGAIDPAVNGGNCRDINHCDLVSEYINPLVNFLAALVGVGVVISIVVGGIQYGSSADDPQKVTAAKARIRNSIIALLVFLFLYSILNFLIPGGLV